jgi:sugar phosphate isomerase/epimerase
MSMEPATGDLVPFLSCSRLGIAPEMEASIALAARHGFALVEPPTGPQLAGRADRARLGELAQRLAAASLSFGPALLPVDLAAPPAGFERALHALPTAARSLRALGVDALSTYIVPAHPTRTYRESFDLHVRRIGACARVLDDDGLRLGIEYVGPRTAWSAARHPFVHTLAETLELLDAVGRGNVGVYLDSFHWHTAGETAADVERLAAAQVIGVDLNDAVPGIPVDEQGDHRRELPGASGVIAVDQLLGALRRIGYRGPVAVEPFSASIRALPDDLAVGACAAALRAVLAG